MDQRPSPVFQQIILALDAAIVSAVRNPTAAAVAPLQQAEALCRTLLAEQANLGEADAAAKDLMTDSIWQIRARLGRLKMLLDTAGVFYRNLPCSALPGSAGCSMDYDMLGEWSAPSAQALLCVDC